MMLYTQLVYIPTLSPEETQCLAEALALVKIECHLIFTSKTSHSAAVTTNYQQ